MYGSRFYVRILGRKCADKHTVMLYVRIKHDGEHGQIMYSTGLKCRIKQFNARKQTVSIDEINNLIQVEKTRLLKIIYNLRAANENINLDLVKKHLKKTQRKETLEDVAQMALEAKRNATTELTHQQSISLLNTLIRKLGMGKRPINSIKPMQLETALTDISSLYKKGSFMQSFGLLNNTFEMAVRKEIISINPLDKVDKKHIYNVGKSATDKERQSYETIRAFLQADKSAYSKLALLQLYTGMAYCDSVAVDKSKIVCMNNQYFIVNNRQKTKVQFLIPIDDCVLNLINTNQFKEVKYSDYYLYLKKNYKITTHDLRHARARELLDRGLPLEAVARILGHTSINMTVRYAPLQGRKLSNEEIQKTLQ